MFHRFLVALIIAGIWVIIGRNQYSYNYTFFEFKGFDWLSFLVWGLGLFVIYNFYLYVINKINTQGIVRQFLVFLVIYWPALIITEIIGYHIFGLHNLATAAYPALPICQCMHAPFWMKIVYFSLGPIYFFINYLLGAFVKIRLKHGQEA